MQEHVPPARAFHTSAREELSRAGADAGDTRDALGEERRKMQCEAQLHARCTDGSRLRQVKTGLLGKLYQVGSCYPRRDFARELLLNTSLLPRSHPPVDRAKILRNVTRIRLCQPYAPPPPNPLTVSTFVYIYMKHAYVCMRVRVYRVHIVDLPVLLPVAVWQKWKAPWCLIKFARDMPIHSA